ncbi:MAG TPA: VanZ family protein [Candidatus Rubneribacter avistercoris]|nr:VanZ family protein [Candidatus Rubneribacter avistercoris]
MSVYASNITLAAMLFPLVALLITLPYLVYQYRKAGSVPWLRTLAVYSFVFYLMCAYFLVLLPLPADRTAFVPYAAVPQLEPLHFLRAFLAETDASLSDPSTWLDAVRDPYVYEALFNVLLLVPLGMYLRYYFRRTWWQTLLIGCAVTLSFELSQLTGLWGLYEHPYRLFDVDDLLTNALGAMTGFWLAGPLMRALPDVRLVEEEARMAGLHAGAVRRALSFGLDLALSLGAAALAVLAARALGRSLDPLAAGTAACLLCFVAVPAVSRGRTPAQGLLRLRTVRPDASPARWYQYLARYGLLLLFATLPAAALALVLSAGSHGGEAGALARFVGANRAFFTGAWAVLMAAWTTSLVVRAVRSSRTRTPFVMLNGLMSNTRVMTEEGARMERERRRALDVEDVVRLERMIAEDGTPLADLMERAGRAVAQKVVDWVPDPAPVTVLAGAGNNGGDGWVAARALAERGYPVTLVTPDIAERLRAEPARATALDVFADAAARRLPLRVLVAPDADVLADVLDEASAVVDALLGTGFSGNEVREPYAGWIRAANRRRFEGSRGKGRGRHRKREREKARHARAAKGAPAKAKDAPFALAVDTPSGLSAQTGRVASPCFAADMTLTMLAYKPGLVQPRASRWTGAVMLARLADIEPYLNGKGIGGR